jgi:hypothetical protein
MTRMHTSKSWITFPQNVMSGSFSVQFFSFFSTLKEITLFQYQKMLGWYLNQNIGQSSQSALASIRYAVFSYTNTIHLVHLLNFIPPNLM